MRRKAILLVTAMAAALVLCSTAAFAAIKIGTNNSETLTGTQEADEISGLGGNDLLRGLRGNDVYHFDDGFGEDKLKELKKRSGGSDLVDFSEVDDSAMRIALFPEFDNIYSTGCLGVGTGDCSEARAITHSYPRTVNGKVDFTKTVPERATGGSQDDIIVGGKEKNVLSGGPGSDFLGDFGGFLAEDEEGRPKLAASNDTFIAGEGYHDLILDLGGKADTLDLSAMGNFSEVSIGKLPDHSDEGAGIHLVFAKPAESVAVAVFGGVAPSSIFSPIEQKNGVMETVIFADGAKSAAEVLAKAEGYAEAQEEAASSSASFSSADQQQQQLAERAKKLLEDAQATLPLFGKNGAAGE